MNLRFYVLEMALMFASSAGWLSAADSSRTASNEENKRNALISYERLMENLELKGDGRASFESGSSENGDKVTEFGGSNFFTGGFQFGNSYGNEWNSLAEILESDSAPRTSATLILPGENPDPNQLRRLHEDMVVFSEILQEGLHPLLMRPDEMNTAGSSGQQNPSTYIEGYGAVFPLYVDFPLIDRGNRGVSPKADRKDLVWETAKERIWNSRPSGKATDVSFDAQRIERLKDTLMETMRHGSNIRGLSETDWIVVAVQCRPPRAQIGFDYFYGKASAGASTAGAANSRNTPSAVILRVSKGVVDAFAEDRMTKEDFRKKVHVITY